MIELTTGIAFLISSIYGTSTAQFDASATQDAIGNNENQISLHDEGDFIDPVAVEAYVRKVYADEPILVDIAHCESTFRQFDKSGNIIRGKVNKADVGVMQINEKYHAVDAAKLGYNIYTIKGNLGYAKYLFDKKGSNPWDSSSPCWSQRVLARAN